MKYEIVRPISKAVTGIALVYTLLNPSQSYAQDQNSLENVPRDSSKTLVNKLDSTSQSENYNKYSLARRNMEDLTNSEKSYLLRHLVERESKGDPKAVNTVVREKKDNNGVVVGLDTIYSVGVGQINISPTGALTDYNIYHPTNQFLPEDMFDPVKNSKVMNWYFFKRIPKLLEERGFVTNVANSLAAYNTGIGNLDLRAKGDAIKNFSELPSITQKYINEITGEDF